MFIDHFNENDQMIPANAMGFKILIVFKNMIP